MRVEKISDHIHLIDLEPAGIEDFVASYVLKGENVIIVEAGPASTAENLLSGLRELNVDPIKVAYVAVSHIHLDHGGAAGTLTEHFPKAKVIIHHRGAPHAADPAKLWTEAKKALGDTAEMYGRPEPVPEERIIPTVDGMTFEAGNGVTLKAVETLGHSSHHLSFYETLSKGVFTGDAAGIYLNRMDLVVPTTPPPFRLDIAVTSLHKLIKLKPRFLYYSHFGKAYKATHNLEAYIKQLRLWAQVAAQENEEDTSLEALSRRILESDATLRKAEEHIKRHPVLNKTVLCHSVEGILKFMEKLGKTPLQ